MPKRHVAPRVDLHPTPLELDPRQVGQGEVHVVATDQEVVAHREALELEAAVLLADPDQAEVGGAAAGVGDQDSVSGCELAPPGVSAFGQPGVDGGLRLFEEHHIFRESGRGHRLAGQLTSPGVEGSRYGDHHPLLREGMLGMGLVPSRRQVLEIKTRGVDRGQLRHVLAGAPGKDRSAPIDMRMGEPALGGRHDPIGSFGGTSPRQLAGDLSAPGAPGEVEEATLGLRVGRQVEEGRQLTLRLKGLRGHHLG